MAMMPSRPGFQAESKEEEQKCDICINTKLEEMLNIKLNPHKSCKEDIWEIFGSVQNSANYSINVKLG